MAVPEVPRPRRKQRKHRPDDLAALGENLDLVVLLHPRLRRHTVLFDVEMHALTAEGFEFEGRLALRAERPPALKARPCELLPFFRDHEERGGQEEYDHPERESRPQEHRIFRIAGLQGPREALVEKLELVERHLPRRHDRGIVREGYQLILLRIGEFLVLLGIYPGGP